MNDDINHILTALSKAQDTLKRGVTAGEVAKQTKFTRDYVRKTLTSLSKSRKVYIEGDKYFTGKI